MSVKTINDIIFEYETCEYSQENLDITRDILNLQLLEEKALASEYLDENYEMVTESVSMDYFMETFEEPKKVANEIVKRGKNIYNQICKGTKSVVNTVAKFIDNKVKLVNDLITPAANIRKYITNKPYNEKAAGIIKKAISSAKGKGNITPGKGQDIALGKYASALGDVKDDLAVALNGTVTVIGSGSESEVGPIDISKLSYYLAQASTGSDSVFKGLQTSLKSEAEKASTKGVTLNFDKAFSKSSAQLKKIESKLENVMNKPAPKSTTVDSQSEKLTDAQSITNILKKIVGATMKLYSNVLNYRKSFISSVSKSLLNTPLNVAREKTAKAIGKVKDAVEPKNESFEDWDLSAEEDYFNESTEEDEEYTGYQF